MESSLNSVWPDWEIAERISKGAFGKVYKAIRKKNGDVAAIKIISIPQNMEDVETMRYQFSDETIKNSYKDQAEEVLKEIEIMKKLSGSSNIVGIQDYELVEKTGGIGCDIYIRMELLQPMVMHLKDLEVNQNFANYILPEKEIIKIGIDICRALETCHTVTTETKKSIIHRDIKPENILYHENSDSYKLGDFGVSKELDNTDSNLTRSIGTAFYMAPEISNRKYDCRVDIYSLGLVLYYLSNKERLPFVKEAGRRKEEIDAYERRMTGEPLPPPENTSPELAAVILRACSYKPQDRYASAKDFRSALENATKKTLPEQEVPKKPEDQKPVTPVPTLGEFGPKKRKRKTFWIIFVVLGLLVAGLIAAIFYPGKSEHPPVLGEEISASKASDAIISSTTLCSESYETEPLGKTKETAVSVVLSNLYNIKTEDEDDWEHWYQLETSQNESNYFFSLCGSDPSYSVDIEVLNNNLEKITDGWSRDQTLELGTYLYPDTSYWIKITGDKHIASYQFLVDEKLCDAGNSRKSALPIQLNTEYIKSIAVDGEVDWYTFTTTEIESIYRVFVNSKANDNPVYGQTTFALYDADGIKLEHVVLDYQKSGYFDIYLSPKTSYAIKISSEHTVPSTGDYLLKVTDHPIDAGLDQTNAKPSEIGTRYTGKLDCSFADWYVFTFENAGKYVLDFHNIDTGCSVNISGSSGANFSTSVFSTSVKNEDSGSHEFNVEAGLKLYLRVKPLWKNDEENVNGTYIFIITEKETLYNEYI